MSRKLLAPVFIALITCSARPNQASAWAGNLTKPGISIPVGGPGKKPDVVAEGLYRVLAAHEKDFTGGYFLNAQSVLHYAGGTKAVNSLLGELAKVDGATIKIGFSKDQGTTRFFAAEKVEPRPCDCSVEHFGWGDGRTVQLTIYLGGKDFDPSDLEIPSIRGR